MYLLNCMIGREIEMGRLRDRDLPWISSHPECPQYLLCVKARSQEFNGSLPHRVTGAVTATLQGLTPAGVSSQAGYGTLVIRTGT